MTDSIVDSNGFKLSYLKGHVLCTNHLTQAFNLFSLLTVV